MQGGRRHGEFDSGQSAIRHFKFQTSTQHVRIDGGQRPEMPVVKAPTLK